MALVGKRDGRNFGYGRQLSYALVNNAGYMVSLNAKNTIGGGSEGSCSRISVMDWKYTAYGEISDG